MLEENREITKARKRRNKKTLAKMHEDGELGIFLGYTEDGWRRRTPYYMAHVKYIARKGFREDHLDEDGQFISDCNRVYTELQENEDDEELDGSLDDGLDEEPWDI